MVKNVVSGISLDLNPGSFSYRLYALGQSLFEPSHL